jgi:hypothetical protein
MKVPPMSGAARQLARTLPFRRTDINAPPKQSKVALPRTEL